jgi:sulfur transfer complex TusBCD TusB component (DsrH family)
MSEITEGVRQYIESHPVVADAIRMGIANNSAVARRIAKDRQYSQFQAVLAAVRRYPLVGPTTQRDEVVRRVLRQSRIETRTKIATVTVTQGIDVLQRLGDVVEELLDENSICRLIQVSRGTVIILEEDSVPRLTKRLRESQIIGTRRGLVELAVTSPESIEQTPGLLALLASVLAARGINIVQGMSCYTDTIFILGRADMTRAVEALTGALE